LEKEKEQLEKQNQRLEEEIERLRKELEAAKRAAGRQAEKQPVNFGVPNFPNFACFKTSCMIL